MASKFIKKQKRVAKITANLYLLLSTIKYSIPIFRELPLLPNKISVIMNLVQERNGRTTEFAFSVPKRDFVFVEVVDLDTLKTISVRKVDKNLYFQSSQNPPRQTAVQAESES